MRLLLLLMSCSTDDFAEDLGRFGLNLLVLPTLESQGLGEFDTLALSVDIGSHFRCLKSERTHLNRLDLLDDIYESS